MLLGYDAPLPPPAPTSMNKDIMSLAVLPSSPVSYGEHAALMGKHPSRPSSTKRPRLSLNTADVPLVYSKGSTSLRVEMLSATSPTARNTFTNAYQSFLSQPPHHGSKPALRALKTNVSASFSRPPTPSQRGAPDVVDNADLPSLCGSATSASTIDTLPAEVPYQLEHDVVPILRNGPSSGLIQHGCSTLLAPDPFAPKSVAFRTPLTEEVITTKYTWKHSDIEPSVLTISISQIHCLEDERRSEVSSDTKAIVQSPRLGDKRESSDEDDSDSCAATPVAGRRKRHRIWRWTLGSPPPSTVEGEMDGGAEGERHRTDKGAP